MAASLIRQFAFQLVLAAELFSVLHGWAKDVPAPAPAEAAVRKFQDALFLSTRNYERSGAKAVDLYWKASDLGASGVIDDRFRRNLSTLYEALAGEGIIHATLFNDGWRLGAGRRRLLLTEGQSFDGLLVIVSNRTAHKAVVSASLRASALRLGTRRTLELDPDESIAFTAALEAHEIRSGAALLHFESGGQSASTRLRIEVRPAVLLRLRIVDFQGRPTPARVYVHAADGLSHLPPACFDRIMWMTGEHYFYSTGNSELVLPAGAVRVEVRKGFDYLPTIKQLELKPKHPLDLDIPLAWLRNMSAEGWYAGDDHIHGNYTGDQWSTPSNDLLVVRAEGLKVANMMVSNSSGDTVHDERYFEGKVNGFSTEDAVLYWNQEMRTWSYGHLLLLNLNRLVRPLYTGFPGSHNWEDYPTNYSQAQQAQRQGGTVVYAHPALRFNDIPTGSLAGEAVADVALGGIDAFEVFCSHDEASMELWYRFLNLGFKLGIAGGSDAFLNQPFSFLAGGERVYAYTGKHFDYAAWMDALKQGRSFATVGPLLDFQVEGKDPGSQRKVSSGPETVSVVIRAVSAIPISRAELVEKGRVIAEASSLRPTHRLEWKGKVTVQESTWLAARVWGPGNDRIGNGPSRWSQRRSENVVLLAHSSPSYVYIGRQPIFSNSDRDFCIEWVDRLVDRISKEGKFGSDAHRAEVLAGFARARKVYERMGPIIAEAHQ